MVIDSPFGEVTATVIKLTVIKLTVSTVNSSNSYNYSNT